MGGDKQGSKRGGSYVGGFLQMFDWNAKSRKKLFASKSDLPEQSKQKRRIERNLQATQLLMEETATGYSVKGSDYSCASSMTDEDGYGAKPPGVIGRLMGLDSLPSSFNEIAMEYQCEKLDDSAKLQLKAINKPIEKFQTEILPPRSAKSIPITHHKLLSPIKRPDFVPSYKEPAAVMEAAAKIIEPALLKSNTKNTKLPSLGAPPSIPLRTKELKVKASSSSKMSVSAVKGQGSSKAGSDDLTNMNKKAKSISLALQAKVNIQRKEGLSQIFSENANGQKDQTNNTSSNRTLKIQPKNSQKNSLSALRQNHQKQNCPTDNRESHSVSKTLSKLQGKPLQGDSSQRRDKRPSGNSKIGSRKFDQESGLIRKQDVSFSTAKTVPRKKRVIDKNDKPVPSDLLIDRQKGVDIVSFTFTAPMSRSRKNEGFQRQRMTLDESDDGGQKMKLLEYNVIGCDYALSSLLEVKLKELTNGAESSASSCTKAGSNCFSASFPEFSSADPETQDQETDPSSRNSKQILQRFPSPISVLDHSPESADSNSIESSSRLCSSSSVQPQEAVGIKSFKFNSMENYNPDLSGSACSTSTTAMTINQELDLFATKEWELEYVKEILSDVEPTFDNYASGKSKETTNPQINHNGETFKLTRKLLFDCVSETMELRFRNYSSGSWNAFERGMLSMRRKDMLAEEVYKEISVLGEMGRGDTMVDDLVHRDMSSQYGKWLDFEAEGFETGLEIEDQILDKLMHELVLESLNGGWF